MQNLRLNDSVREEIISAMRPIGYTTEMIGHDVGFIGKGGKSYKTDLVAYSDFLRKDTDTAVIAVKVVDDIQKVRYDSDILPFAALSTPIVILAENESTRDKEPRLGTFGLSKDALSFDSQKKKRTDNIVPLARFKEYMQRHRVEFTPRRIERVKWFSEQLSLFDIAPNLNELALEITNTELIERFENGVKSILRSQDEKSYENIIKSSIKLLGIRILRDRLNKNWSLSSADEFLSEASKFLPKYLKIPSKIAKMISPLLERFHPGFDFSQVSMETVGRFYESAFVTKKNRAMWGIHYTPARLAKTLLERMPIEELPPDQRILADPTCGSGSLLSAGYERLAKASYANIPKEERHDKLIKSIFGNDSDGFATEIARMTLLLFHPPHKNNWTISKLNVEKEDFARKWMKKIKNKTNAKPTIIVANPPFGGVGGKKHDGVSRTSIVSQKF